MFWNVWSQIARGKTLMRAMMNIALSRFTLSGTVVDLGGGKNPSYMQYLTRGEGVTFANIDIQHGEGAARAVDFETDALPYADGSVDTILMLNLLEHIYNHTHLVREAHRILGAGKTVTGFVPFLVNYHADPHDYFRYTDEALERIFREAGFSAIEINTIGMGPFAVHLNDLTSFLPRWFTIFMWPGIFVADSFFLKLKPSLRKRFALGYLFVLTK
jgi:SAM-dependent methyltransferase